MLDPAPRRIADQASSLAEAGVDVDEAAAGLLIDAKPVDLPAAATLARRVGPVAQRERASEIVDRAQEMHQARASRWVLAIQLIVHWVGATVVSVAAAIQGEGSLIVFAAVYCMWILALTGSAVLVHRRQTRIRRDYRAAVEVVRRRREDSSDSLA